MYVLGTAGHVDHGKSTLIHALTGIDPDRLAEEKRRGLTIDLGFAWLTLPDGREIGIVDVPGHERFVHNMLAGAGSIDATIFVVAANEGWMPQSEEHLQILDLLGARGGVIALTKTDAVDEETAALAETEIRERTAGTVLENAAIVGVSGQTGEGLDALRTQLAALLDRTPQSPDEARPRLFVDRSFSIKGAGTVVTGTLTHGSLSAGDEVEILPAGVRARIRSIQSHRAERERAEPGSRAALNLAGIERHEIRRGDAIVRPGHWRATSSLGAKLRTVRTLKHALSGRGAYKLYLGAAEVDARVTFLEPGGSLVKIKLATDVVASDGDRFVLRDSGRGETVAGGIVLDAHPVADRASRALILERLRARDRAGIEAAATFAVAERGAIPVADLLPLAGRADPPGTTLLRSYVAHDPWLEGVAGAVRSAVAAHHEREPLARGMPREEARRAARVADPRLFAELLEHRADLFAIDGDAVRIAGRTVDMDTNARGAALAAAAGMAPPALSELESAHGQKLVRAMIDGGDLVKIGPGIVFAQQSVDDAKRAIRDAFDREGPLTTSRIREILGTSRKFAIPLLEHLDGTGFTRRDGDVRTIRSPK